MYAENAILNQGGQTQVVKDFCTVSPHVHGAVFSQAFVVKPVNLRNLAAFVVAPDQYNPVRVPHFQCQQQQERFHTVETAIDEIPKKQVIRFWALATDSEKFLEVVELPMDITANLPNRA
jgi:hypothetical protein